MAENRQSGLVVTIGKTGSMYIGDEQEDVEVEDEFFFGNSQQHRYLEVKIALDGSMDENIKERIQGREATTMLIRFCGASRLEKKIIS